MVDRQGGVSQIDIVFSEPMGLFDGSVVQALRQARFNAAQDEGETVKVRVKQTFVFEVG